MIQTLSDLAKFSDFSFMDNLTCDLDADENGDDYNPREVFSGHYVPVKPTPIENPHYITHSKKIFSELGLSDELATSDDFMRMFSGDISDVPKPLREVGWATGYALSIYGTEYYEQCPFGSGYGDGRAISVLEVVVKGKRYEKQLKGGGRTPYCRGADGRAVLRSSIREFLAQELMHSLDVPTTRSLTLYVSKKEKVRRPWFRDGSYSRDPEVMIEESVAISIRVASSFIRVGQLELFGRRARKNEHPDAMRELEQIVLHLIEREYAKEIDANLPLEEKIILLAKEFCNRLTKLVADWIRVGYTQGNFNSDNCSSGGFTLDYGPFGFIDMFDPRYQPWTGGGVHFSFLNQPKAAEVNFDMFCKALEPLLKSKDELYKIRDNFSVVMQQEMQMMWAKKLGMSRFDKNLFEQLMMLMIRSSVDYTIFFRELSNIPQDITPLKKSFYSDIPEDALIIKEWSDWLDRWRASIDDEKSMQMKQVNPKYTLREWILVPAYEQANNGDYTLLKELQEVMNDPYSEQSLEIEKKYYNKKPSNLFYAAGVSHISCSS